MKPRIEKPVVFNYGDHVRLQEEHYQLKKYAEFLESMLLDDGMTEWICEQMGRDWCMENCGKGQTQATPKCLRKLYETSKEANA